MYIQITTRCNMECAHCGMNCTANGEDMSFEVFEKAIMFDPESSELGGGEPTLHPRFWEFLGYALGYSEWVWLATNGKIADIAIRLANLAKRGVLGCDLSLDEYHEYINPKVIAAFQDGKKSHQWIYDNKSLDRRAIRDTSNNLVNAGRCDWGGDGCICPGLICKPNGTIRACGCVDSPVMGNIMRDDFRIPPDYELGECYKDQLIFD